MSRWPPDHRQVPESGALMVRGSPPNKPLQLTRNSAFQLRFSSILASNLVED